jgi:hypothetical protein
MHQEQKQHGDQGDNTQWNSINLRVSIGLTHRKRKLGPNFSKGLFFGW